MKFNLIPAARRTDPQTIEANGLVVKAFESNIKDLAIVFENDESRQRFFISDTHRDYIHEDISAFKKVWFEFGRLDREYEINLITT